jgi:aminoglycoside phosphotransferase family enzyme
VPLSRRFTGVCQPRSIGANPLARPLQTRGFRKEATVAGTEASVYGERQTAGCEIIETPISRVFLRGEQVFRLEHGELSADGSWGIIDCDDFNPRPRFADLCADLALPTMDVRHRDRHAVAESRRAGAVREAVTAVLRRVC